MQKNQGPGGKKRRSFLFVPFLYNRGELNAIPTKEFIREKLDAILRIE